MDAKTFRDGMTMLSGALDWDGTTPEQIAARTESYWHVLQGFDPAVWHAAVSHVLKTRKPTTDRTGRPVKPGFPYAGELYDLCAQLAASRRPALPAPDITPASPERAREWIKHIKDIVRGARGPLAANLGATIERVETPPPGASA